MGWLNTSANVSSAVSNRRTAQTSYATATYTGQLAAAERRRALRERGLIDDRTTPAGIAKVEHRLAAQMRARAELEGQPRPSAYRGVGVVVAIAVLIGLVVVGNSNGGIGVGGALGLCAILAIPVVITILIARSSEQRRAAVAGRAEWTDDWACGWCGTRTPHLVDGHEEHPRVAHAVEVEREIGGR